MARPLRIEYPGALYHVTSRGDRQEPIFDDDRDRTAFLNVLGDVVSRFRWQCHAYCHVPAIRTQCSPTTPDPPPADAFFESIS